MKTMANEILDRNSPGLCELTVEDGGTRPRFDRMSYGPAALIAASFVPLGIQFGQGLWARPSYQFFPLLLPGAAVLLWRSCRRLGVLEPDRLAGGAAAACAWLLLALGVAVITPWFGAIGALLALLGAAFALGGRPLVRAALPAWGFLWLAVPPPREFDVTLVAKLQTVASHWSSRLLDVLGVYHVMDGNVVTIGGNELLVDQACSGINSLMTLLAGTVFYVLWTKTPLVRSLILVAASVFWVLFGNVARIVAVVLLTGLGIEATSGWRHELLGFLALVLMLAMVVSTDQMVSFVGSGVALMKSLLSWQGRRQWRKEKARAAQAAEGSLFSRTQPSRHPRSAPSENRVAPAPEPEPEPEFEPEGAGAGPERLTDSSEPTHLAGVERTWLGSWFVAAAFGLLLVPQAFMPGPTWNDILAGDVFPRWFAAAKADFLPERVGENRRVDFRTESREGDNSWGEHSRIWSYRGPGRGVAVSLDYSFIGWHDLTQCYRSRGWEMIGLRVEPASPGEGGGGAGVKVAASRLVAEFRSPDGRLGYLAYANYDRRANMLAVPGSVGWVERLRGRLASWVRRDEPVGRVGEVLSYQVQVFTTSDEPPTPTERSAIDALFEAASGRVGRLARQAGGKTP